MRKQLFLTLNPNCFHLDFGAEPHPSSMKTFANFANPGDEQVGSEFNIIVNAGQRAALTWVSSPFR
jgi:hypothetical protein